MFPWKGISWKTNNSLDNELKSCKCGVLFWCDYLGKVWSRMWFIREQSCPHIRVDFNDFKKYLSIQWVLCLEFKFEEGNHRWHSTCKNILLIKEHILSINNILQICQPQYQSDSIVIFQNKYTLSLYQNKHQLAKKLYGDMYILRFCLFIYDFHCVMPDLMQALSMTGLQNQFVVEADSLSFSCFC